jgi:hypothetical protein
MTRHRTIVSILLLAPALSVTLGTPALASSLLSGYGGPGEGNQAILGSTLLNGPRGGGGGGGGAGSVGASGLAVSSSSGSTGIALPRTGADGVSRHSGSPTDAGHGKRAAGGIGRSSVRAVSPYPVSEQDRAAQSVGADSGAFGLSGADLLYLLLAVCGLAVTAVLTARLTRIAAAGRHE